MYFNIHQTKGEINMARTRRKRTQIAPPNTAVIYARYSSKNQREESIDAQLRACRAYAQEHGLTIIKEYTDSAKTGTNGNRSEFQQMLEDSGKYLFDTVIVHKLDRFSRNRRDSAIANQTLYENNCKLMSVLERLDDEPESIMMESTLVGMAEYYSKNLAREVKKGQRETALQCKHCGGTPPLGYDVDKETHQYIINEKEADTVRLIFKLYSEGCGYKYILRHLNAMGHHTKAGNLFANGSLNNLLKNEKYKGIYTYNLKKERDRRGVRRPQLNPEKEIIRIDDGMPRIIDDVTFAKVQAKLVNNLTRGGSFKAKEIYLLSGLIYCGGCGLSMHGNSRYCGRNKLQYITYKCPGRSQQRDCHRKELNKTYIENFVLDTLYQNLFNANSIQQLTAMLNQYRNENNKENIDEIENTSSRLNVVNKNISSTLEIIYQTGISLETVKDKLKELEGQKEYLEDHLRQLSINNDLQVSEQIVSELVEKSKDFIKSKNLPQCKIFIESYIDRVMVFDEYVEVKFKINVPTKDNSGFEPLVVRSTLKNIYDNYKDAV